jgi:hypothetical protein
MDLSYRMRICGTSNRRIPRDQEPTVAAGRCMAGVTSACRELRVKGPGAYRHFRAASRRRSGSFIHDDDVGVNWKSQSSNLTPASSLLASFCLRGDDRRTVFETKENRGEKEGMNTEERYRVCGLRRSFRRPACEVNGAVKGVLLLRRGRGSHLRTLHDDHPHLDVSLVR